MVASSTPAGVDRFSGCENRRHECHMIINEAATRWCHHEMALQFGDLSCLQRLSCKTAAALEKEKYPTNQRSNLKLTENNLLPDPQFVAKIHEQQLISLIVPSSAQDRELNWGVSTEIEANDDA
ncbi:hypothetical protein TNCV_202711 [Trichonephila clavipes]|nr:hypothetical protein TNCV_202711 [Trichonephila clavipes]